MNSTAFRPIRRSLPFTLSNLFNQIRHLRRSPTALLCRNLLMMSFCGVSGTVFFCNPQVLSALMSSGQARVVALVLMVSAAVGLLGNWVDGTVIGVVYFGVFFCTMGAFVSEFSYDTAVFAGWVVLGVSALLGAFTGLLWLQAKLDSRI